MLNIYNIKIIIYPILYWVIRVHSVSSPIAYINVSLLNMYCNPGLQCIRRWSLWPSDEISLQDSYLNLWMNPCRDSLHLPQQNYREKMHPEGCQLSSWTKNQSFGVERDKPTEKKRTWEKGQKSEAHSFVHSGIPNRYFVGGELLFWALVCFVWTNIKLGGERSWEDLGRRKIWSKWF